MSIRTLIIAINVVVIVAIAGVVLVRVISLRHNPEPKEPENLTPAFADEEMEGPRLERVLGWALFFVAIIAVAMVALLLVEPTRQSAAEEGFDERAVERGAVLYANEQSPDYDATVSLLCANCHGSDLKGGSAPFVISSQDPSCDPAAEPSADRPECLPVQVQWRAPALDTVLLKYEEEQVREILVYGRPGTPMPAWGVESEKGVLNEQGIADLLAFLEAKQVSSEEAMQRSEEEATALVEAAATAVSDTREKLDEARAAAAAAPDDEDAQRALEVAETNFRIASEYAEQVQAADDGEILFMTNCARCHTRGWSYFDPANGADYPGWEVAPPVQANGAYGPSLLEGASLRQFPPPTGEADQYAWVAQGVPRDNQYGIRGISSGRMPHFENVLTKEQIEAIVRYERSL